MSRIPGAAGRPTRIATYLRPVVVAASWLALVALATGCFFAPRGAEAQPTMDDVIGFGCSMAIAGATAAIAAFGIGGRKRWAVELAPLRLAAGRDHGAAPPLFPLVRPDLRASADGPLVVPSASGWRAALGRTTCRLPRATGGCGGDRARCSRRSAGQVRAATAASGDGRGPRHPVRVRLEPRSAIRPRSGDLGRLETPLPSRAVEHLRRSDLDHGDDLRRDRRGCRRRSWRSIATRPRRVAKSQRHLIRITSGLATQ